MTTPAPDLRPPLFPPPASARPLRVGIVGLGGIALGTHLPCLSLLRRWGWPVVVAAVADPDPARIAQAAATLAASHNATENLRRHSDGETLLAESSGDLDALFLFTPPAVTARLLETVLGGAIPVLAEKPAATDANMLSKLVEAEARRGESAPAVRIGYNRRSQPLAAPFRERLAALRAADTEGVLHVEARLWRAERPDKIYYEDTMVHALDFLLWSLGPLTLRRVERGPKGRGGELSAGLRIVLETAGGPQSPPLSAHLDVRPAVGRDTETCTALGASESLELAYPLHVRGHERARLTHYRAGAESEVEAPGSAARADDPDGLIVRGFLPQMAAFLSEVAGERPAVELPVLCDLQGASRTAQLRRAVIESLTEEPST